MCAVALKSVSDQPETRPGSVAELFGLQAAANQTVPVFTNDTHPAIPRLNPQHVWSREMFRDLNAFFLRPHKDCLMLMGDTATGKTSGVEQYASRTNWPCLSYTCSERTEIKDLVGQFIFASDKPGEQPQMRWVDGPLTLAMRHGYILLLNEINLMPPGETTGLNGVRDGGPLIIPENGAEIVPRHPNFRLVVTGNTGLAYAGTIEQNIAFLDGFRCLKVDYLPEDVEVQLLTQQFPALPVDPVIKGMVQVANDCRAAYRADQIGSPLSTRGLLRWAALTQDFKQAPNPMEYALHQAYLNLLPPEQQLAVLRICQDRFGEDLWPSKED